MRERERGRIRCQREKKNREREIRKGKEERRTYKELGLHTTFSSYISHGSFFSR